VPVGFCGHSWRRPNSSFSREHDECTVMQRRTGLAGRAGLTSGRRTRDATRVLATLGFSPPCPKRTSHDYAGALHLTATFATRHLRPVNCSSRIRVCPGLLLAFALARSTVIAGSPLPSVPYGRLPGMTGADPKSDLHRYLQAAREALLWKLDGLSEYDIRRPLTPTGTNLLGLVKHLAGVEF
jgi:Protein of unknown function (DUF664)